MYNLNEHDDYESEAYDVEIADFMTSGTRRVPQFDTSDGRTHRDREAIISTHEVLR